MAGCRFHVEHIAKAPKMIGAVIVSVLKFMGLEAQKQGVFVHIWRFVVQGLTTCSVSVVQSVQNYHSVSRVVFLLMRPPLLARGRGGSNLWL